MIRRLTTWSIAAALALTVLAPPVRAVQPHERLDDPGLEARARDLSADLRCVVCQNQSIDDSNAPLARDLRVLVRERLVAGDTDDQVLAFVSARYGDYVLLSPPLRASTLILWLAGPAVLVAAGVGVAVWLRRRGHAAVQEPAAPLSAAEEARLARLLDTQDAEGPRG